MKTRLSRLSDEWDQGQQQFREHVREELDRLIESRQWKRSFVGRLLGLVGMQRELGADDRAPSGRRARPRDRRGTTGGDGSHRASARTARP